MLRVYALYRKSRTIGAFLVFILWGQVALDITIVPRVVNVRYDAICDTRETSIAVLYFRYDLMKLRAPIVRVVTRDGAWIMFIVCGVFAGITPVAVRNQVSKAHMILGWPITILSVASCRMIMNMQTLDLSSTTTTDVEHDSVTLTELDTLQIELQDM
uniref:Uncharacterized protein n=1 Tax=Psilocybe cubensis TaxID=181762 RepID=A0A8H7XK11_PSICU